jgi:hypothetical protein
VRRVVYAASFVDDTEVQFVHIVDGRRRKGAIAF